MKILGSDYDGTLAHGGMNDVKLSAIQKWRKAGHKFGIVSGRDIDFCKNLLQEIPRLQFDFFCRLQWRIYYGWKRFSDIRGSV